VLSAVNSTASTISSVSTDSTADQSFCNRDCYFSYCFRLAEELDCPADDIIEGDYHSVNAYISAQVDADVEDDTEHSYAEAASYQQQQPARVLQISQVH